MIFLNIVHKSKQIDRCTNINDTENPTPTTVISISNKHPLSRHKYSTYLYINN